MDGGIGGINETIEILSKQGFDFFGINIPQISIDIPTLRLDMDGKPVSIIGAAVEEFNSFSEFGYGSYLIEPVKLWSLIKQEQEKGREVIVSLHGGVEYEHLQPPWLRKICHWIIDMGAIAVITHHPHVSGYVEKYNDKPIAWSLGNFWFTEGGGKDFYNCLGYAFELYFDDKNQISWNVIPYYSDYEEGTIRELSGKEKLDWNYLIEYIQDHLYSEKNYENWWRNIVKKKREIYISKYSLAPLPRYLKWFIRKFMMTFIFKGVWRLRQLNGLRCRSHYEIWKESLIIKQFEND